MHKVVICGPESTGKTTLARYLANYYNTKWIPEYAREYIGNLDRAYTYQDVEIIAKKQVKQFQEDANLNKDYVFFDTGLIITKVWFLEVFRDYPKWLDEKIEECMPSLYLLCYHDIDWEFDPLRENGSDERRAYFFNKYLEEIKKTGCKYQIIRGFTKERYKLAIQTIDKTFLRC